jgi:curli production assembly/transport component CsgE
MVNRLHCSHKTMFRIFGIFMGAFFLVSWIAASGQAQEGYATDEGLEIPGLILDETKTKQGRDFFEIFNLGWEEIEGLNYVISIVEFPDSRRGSFIIVNVDDNRVFMERLNPQPTMVEESAQRAVQRVGIYLLQKMVAQQNLEKEFQY